MPRKPTQGGCLCAAVRYAVRGSIRPVVACHCTQCRKTSGHYVAATAARAVDTEIQDPDGCLRWYRSSEFAERGFCSRCGGNLFWRRHDGDLISIMAGTLNGPTRLKLTTHIFTAQKGDYYSIEHDGATKLEGGGHDYWDAADPSWLQEDKLD